MSRRTALTTLAATLGAAGVLTGCGSDEGSPTSESERPKNPPPTLERTVVQDPVTVDTAAATHDGDVTIDRATGRIYLAWASDGKKKGDSTPSNVMFASSDDAGRTFSEPKRVNPPETNVSAGFNAGVRVVSTGEDRVLVIWPYSEGGHHGVYHVMSQLSTDGGKTWNKPEPVSRSAHGEASELYGGIATYGKNVFVGYLDYAAQVTGAKAVRSSDGGRSFTAPSQVDPTTCECCDNALAVNSEGTLFFAYRNKDSQTKNTQIRDTAVVRSYDLGATWTDPVLLNEDNWEFNGCPESGPELWVDAEDVVHAVYWTGKPGRPGVYYTYSEDDGASFAEVQAVAVDGFYPPPYVDIAFQEDGTGWIVWDDRRTKDRAVQLARVQDGKLETTDGSLDAGVTPAVDSDGSMVVMSWSNADGLHVSTTGEPAREGFGSGPGDEHSGQDEHAASGH